MERVLYPLPFSTSETRRKINTDAAMERPLYRMEPPLQNYPYAQTEDNLGKGLHTRAHRLRKKESL